MILNSVSPVQMKSRYLSIMPLVVGEIEMIWQSLHIAGESVDKIQTYKAIRYIRIPGNIKHVSVSNHAEFSALAKLSEWR